jgi:hypothetical protein
MQSAIERQREKCESDGERERERERERSGKDSAKKTFKPLPAGPALDGAVHAATRF